MPVPVCPSPKVQKYPDIVPPGSVLGLASRVAPVKAVVLVTLIVKDATGGVPNMIDAESLPEAV